MAARMQGWFVLGAQVGGGGEQSWLEKSFPWYMCKAYWQRIQREELGNSRGKVNPRKTPQPKEPTHFLPLGPAPQHHTQVLR